jgi:hypothetical protein
VTTLTARLVRRADLHTVVTELPLSRERHWLDQLNEPGSGSVILQADDVALGAVLDGDVIQFLLDGSVAFAYLVRTRTHVAIDPNEAAGQITTLEGPGCSPGPPTATTTPGGPRPSSSPTWGARCGARPSRPTRSPARPR